MLATCTQNYYNNLANQEGIFMANKVTVNAEIDSKLFNKTKPILDQLGITTSTLIQMLYSEIVLTDDVPDFFRCLTSSFKFYEEMTEEELEADYIKAQEDYKNGKFISFKEFEQELYEKYGV